MPKKKIQSAKTNRGWIVDQLLTIGQLEAALSHVDEYSIARDNYAELGKSIYAVRKSIMEELFETAEDNQLWCIIKHLSTAYVLAEEVCHANGYDTDKEILMTGVGDVLAGATEMAFGLEKTECLRCLSERSGNDKSS